MHVLIACKFKKDQITSNQEKVVTSILRRSRAANSVVSGEIWPKFKRNQSFMHVLISCIYVKDPIKDGGENVMNSFSPLQAYGIFFRRSRAANFVERSRIRSNFELKQALMYVVITCKYEKNPIKTVEKT